MSKPTWQTHAQPSDPGRFGRRIPDTDTILGIVKGLRVDPAEVMLAIGETLGVIPADRPRPELIELLPPAEVLARLSREDVDTIVRLIGLLADAHGPAPVPAAAPVADPAPVAAQHAATSRTPEQRAAARRASAAAAAELQAMTNTQRTRRGDGPQQTALSFVQAGTA